MWIVAIAAAEPASPSCVAVTRANADGAARWAAQDAVGAVAAWSSVVEPDPTCADAAELCTNLGHAHLVAGRLDQARRQLFRCGDRPAALLYLGDALAREGWRNPAREAYRRVSEVGGSPAQGELARAALADLGPDEPPAPDRPCSAVAGVGEELFALCADADTGRSGGSTLHRSADLGRTWVRLRADDGLDGLGVTVSGAVVLHTSLRLPQRPGTVVVSTDGGRTFEARAAPSGHLTVVGDQLAVEVFFDDWRASADLGVTWSGRENPGGIGRSLAQVGPVTLALDTTAVHDGYAAALSRSRDGRSWTRVHTWPHDGSSDGTAVGGLGDRWVVTGVAHDGHDFYPWASTTANGGRTWADLPMTPPLWAPGDPVVETSSWSAVWADPWVIGGTGARCSTQYAADGVHFTVVRSQPEAMARGVSALWGHGQRVVAVGPGGLFVSEDGGATWVDRTP